MFEVGICKNDFHVDLVAVIMVKGPNYSLIGHRPPCRIIGCKGRCGFLISHGENSPMMPLSRWTDDH